MSYNEDITYTEPVTETRDVNTDEYRIRKLEIAQARTDEKGKSTDEKIKNLETSIERLTVSVDNLNKTLTQAQGGWKVLVIQGTLVATLVGIVVAILEYFKN